MINASKNDQGRFTAEESYSAPDLEDATASRLEEPKMNRLPNIRTKSTRGQGKLRRKSTSSLSGVKQEGDDHSQSQEHYHHRGLGMHISDNTLFPVTPDTSELEIVVNERVRPVPRPFADTYTPRSGHSQNDPFDDVPSPSEIIHQEKTTC